MKKKNRDRSHLRLVKSKEHTKESQTSINENQAKALSEIIKESLLWRGLSPGEILLPTLTLGFLIGISIFLIYGLIQA
jgi:hypothetical protein